MATSRFSIGSRALYTAPIAPFPKTDLISKRPKFVEAMLLIPGMPLIASDLNRLVRNTIWTSLCGGLLLLPPVLLLLKIAGQSRF